MHTTNMLLPKQLHAWLDFDSAAWIISHQSSAARLAFLIVSSVHRRIDVPREKPTSSPAMAEKPRERVILRTVGHFEAKL